MKKMARSQFIEDIIARAKTNPKTIVLPEGNDPRILEAAHFLAKEGIAQVILLGNGASKTSTGIQVIDPATSKQLQEYAHSFYELRKHKGLTPEQAFDTVKHANYFGTMMVHHGDADGLVSGAIHPTAEVFQPALRILKGSFVSSVFFMCCDQTTYIFSDCALVEHPNSEQLAKIAVSSSLTALEFGIPANVALLSYSTKGSAKSSLVNKVISATEKAQSILAQNYADLPIKIEGELQLDAAVFPAIRRQKAPKSSLEGPARVLVFPDLNAGNIGYKLLSCLGSSEAYGPILQGLNKPVNDLSRGCSVDDIIGVAAITVLKAQNPQHGANV